MKLDEPNNTNKPKVLINKKKETHNDINQLLSDANLSLADLLSPLKSISINTSFDAFYNFKEFEQIKREFEKVIQSQTNIIFYVLHNNFMGDEAHREFFKNIVGRFYDLPERLWKYYKGIMHIKYGSADILSGLVLLENYHLYKKASAGDYSLFKTTFQARNSRETNGYYFNQSAIYHLSGYKVHDATNRLLTRYTYSGSDNLHFCSYGDRASRLFDNNYTTYRFSTNYKSTNYWYIPDDNEILEISKYGYERYPYIATFYIDKFKDYINQFKSSQERIVIEDYEYSLDEFKIIHSLSQKLPWSKEYIFENEEYLNLDVLGLNMTVPWDIELVKFFIERGYGGRMSENKAVFDKVFEPILNDTILDKLFKCEYTRYD